MSSAKPTREQADLADVLELILDKGIVINADIAITIGETEMIGIELRAAIASFETAAEYGLAFPSGTDMRRVEQASGRTPLDEEGEGDEIDLGIKASTEGESSGRSSDPPARRPHPTIPLNVEGDVAEETETESGNEEDEKDKMDEEDEVNEDNASDEAEETDSEGADRDDSDDSAENEADATDDTADAEGGDPENP